jgi:hypothetical protein
MRCLRRILTLGHPNNTMRNLHYFKKGFFGICLLATIVTFSLYVIPSEPVEAARNDLGGTSVDDHSGKVDLGENRAPTTSLSGASKELRAAVECINDPSDERRRNNFSELAKGLKPDDITHCLLLISEREAAGGNFSFEKLALWRLRVAADPDLALQTLSNQLCSSRPSSARFKDTVVIVADCLPLIPGPRAKMWFESLPKDEPGTNARRAILNAVTKQMLEVDVPATAEWIKSNSIEHWRNHNAINTVAAALAAKDPAEAIQWVLTVPRDPYNGTIAGVGSVVDKWASKDPAGFEEWLCSQEGTQVFAQAAGHYAVMIAPLHYDRAMQWIERIQNYPDMRNYFQRHAMAAAEKRN